jgi:hypothetical protein
MFYWPCIIVYQYNEINVMHFSFNLVRIKGLYMFRALLAHSQEALHKQLMVHCVRISVGCGTVARNIQNAVCVALPEDEQVMLETCRGSWLSINWMKSASRWFHYTDISYISMPVINYLFQKHRMTSDSSNVLFVTVDRSDKCWRAYINFYCRYVNHIRIWPDLQHCL